MIVFEFESSSQVEAIICLIEQGIQMEKLNLDAQHVLETATVESRLKILHGENVVTQLTVASLG